MAFTGPTTLDTEGTQGPDHQGQSENRPTVVTKNLVLERSRKPHSEEPELGNPWSVGGRVGSSV